MTAFWKNTLVICAILAACSSLELNSDYGFEDYLVQFNKSYTEPEYSTRKELFDHNFKEILDFNANESNTFKREVNKFTDWSDTERESKNIII